MIRTVSIILITLFLTLFNTDKAQSFYSQHPVELYEKGEEILNNYVGQTQQLTEAQKYYIHIIKKFPQSPLGYLGMSRIHRINAYLYGDHYNMKLIREDALPFAIRALELGSSLRTIHENYSVFEKIFEDYDNYRKVAQESLYLSPDAAETQFNIANLLRDQGEIERALKYYEKALEVSDTNNFKLKILKRIALIYLDEFNEPQKAVEYYLKALEIQRNSANINEYLGIAYFKLGQYKDSIDQLSISLNNIFSAHTQFLLLQAKGYMSEKEGKIEDAIQLLTQATRYGEATGRLHFTLGDLYFKKENYEDAYNHFKQVIDMEPEVSKAYYFAGRSIQSLGDQELAREYFKKYLTLNETSQEADWIRTNIPELTQK